MMARFKLLLSLALLYCLFPLAAFASDCTEDPNECTLKKLCEVATALDGDTIIWSTLSSSAKHVTVAKTLGMECGVTPIVDLCETDPNECKVSEICTKATTVSAGQISWDNSAAGHVALAKEYGLQCDVVDYDKVSCSSDLLKNCSNNEICSYATFSGSVLNKRKWKEKYQQSYVKEAKKRGLACGVDVAVKKRCSNITPEGCDAKEVCLYATRPTARANEREWSSMASSTGPYVKEAKKRGLACGVRIIATNFEKAFTSQSRLKRQQLQYALKKLGYYSYDIDGLWGTGTRSGFNQFINATNLDGETETHVFNDILSRVNVPSSFAAPKPKRIPKSSNTNGLKSISSNPSIAADQAYAVCLPLAQQAKSQASNQPKQVLRPSPYSTTCKQNYAGNFDCSSRRASGGFWGGVADGVASSSAGRGAYNAVLDSCLAQYGWRKP